LSVSSIPDSKQTLDRINKGRNEINFIANKKREGKLTVRRRLTPLRAAAKWASCALLAEKEKMDTGDPSSS
jgi:hypothetical protein